MTQTNNESIKHESEALLLKQLPVRDCTSVEHNNEYK